MEELSEDVSPPVEGADGVMEDSIDQNNVDKTLSGLTGATSETMDVDLASSMQDGEEIVKSEIPEGVNEIMDRYVPYEEEIDLDGPDIRAARRAGFHPHRMTDIERSVFPEYLQYEDDYVLTRNFILMAWKQKSSNFMSWNSVYRRMTVRSFTLFYFPSF